MESTRKKRQGDAACGLGLHAVQFAPLPLVALAAGMDSRFVQKCQGIHPNLPLLSGCFALHLHLLPLRVSAAQHARSLFFRRPFRPCRNLIRMPVRHSSAAGLACGLFAVGFSCAAFVWSYFGTSITQPPLPSG